MKSEYDALIKDNTWEIVDLPPNRRAIGCKWVLRIKRNSAGEVQRYKARLVAKGCAQKYGIDYSEAFSPVARYSSIRIVLAIAVEYELLAHQLDVTTAYLNNVTVIRACTPKTITTKLP